MALTYTKFDRFAEVEAHYNNTKPLRGKDNADKDIRPIGDRKRKYERIVKVSDNCYALSDGFHYGDEHFLRWTHGVGYKSTLDDMAFYAPIVWRRYRDGTEEVTMRNGSGPAQHSMRYAFLWRHSPKGLWFRNRNGKHFIESAITGSSYFLAKGTTVPRPVWEEAQKELKRMKTGDTISWRRKYIEWMRVKDDGASLTFKRTESGWVFASGGKPIPVPPKQRVNKDAKAKLKPYIEAFRGWALAIGPMLPLRDWVYEKDLRDAALLWLEDNGEKPTQYWRLGALMNPKLSRQIITDDEHPLRLQLAYLALTHGELLRECEDQEDAKKAKARFNSWINKQLGLTKQVKG